MALRAAINLLGTPTRPTHQHKRAGWRCQADLGGCGRQEPNKATWPGSRRKSVAETEGDPKQMPSSGCWKSLPPNRRLCLQQLASRVTQLGQQGKETQELAARTRAATSKLTKNQQTQPTWHPPGGRSPAAAPAGTGSATSK